MTLTTFASDPLVWAQKKRDQWAFLLFLLLPVFGCLLFSPVALNPWSKGLTAAAILSFLVAVWVLRRNQQNRAFDPLQEPRVRIIGEHLEFVRERSTYTIAFNDLKRLVIGQNRQGRIYRIELKTAKQKLELSGLQDMAQLTEALVRHAPTTCQIRYQRNWFYGLYPWRWWLLTALFVGLFVWWQMMVYRSAWLITTPLSLYILYRYIKSSSLKANLMLGAIVVLLNLGNLLEWIDNVRWNAAAVWQQPCSLVQRITRPGLCLRTIEDAEYLYFSGTDNTLMWADGTVVVQAPVNSWLGFWTPTLAHERSVMFLRPSAQDQAIIATTFDFDLPGNRAFWIWHQDQSVPSGPYIHPDRIAPQSIALAPDGSRFAIAGEEGIRLLDAATGESVILLAQDVDGDPLTFSPDGRYLFSVTENEQPVMWDVSEQIEVTVFPLPDDFETFGAQAIALSADGRWLAVVYRQSVVVWDVQAVRIRRQITLPGATELVFTDAIALVPNGDYLATGVSHLDGEDNYLFLWPLESSDLSTTLYLGPTSSNFAQTLDISSDGELLAVGTESAGYVLALDKLLEK